MIEHGVTEDLTREPALIAADARASGAQVCLNCGSSWEDGQKYCSACGQKTHTPRLTLHEIGEEILHAVVHVDRSALSLIWLLLIQPGVVSLEYVSGKRKRYFGPFGFLVVAVALTSTVIALSGFHAVDSDQPNRVADFLQHHVNLILFANIPLVAAFARLVATRERFNYAEYLVLTAYTGAMHILFYAVIVVPVWYVLKPHPLLLVRLYYAMLPIGPLYFAFAMYQFLPGRRVTSVLKALLASLLAQGAFQGLVSLASRLFE